MTSKAAQGLLPRGRDPNPAAAGRKPPGPRSKDKWLSREVGAIVMVVAFVAFWWIRTRLR